MTKRSEFAAYSSFDGAGERYEPEASPMTTTPEIPAEIMREAERCMRETNTVHHVALALLARDTAARKECAEELKALKHDIERHVEVASELAQENERITANRDMFASRAADYRAALDEALEVVKPLSVMADHYPQKRRYGNRPSTGAIWSTASHEIGEAEITVEHLHAARRFYEKHAGGGK